MVDIQHTALTPTQCHVPLAEGFTGAAASYTPTAADQLVVKTDVTPHIIYRTTGVLAGNVIQIGSVAIESRDEGGSLTSETTVFDFVGAGVTATESAGVVTVTIPGGGGGGSVEVEDEGISLTTGVTKFDFVGAGVTATEPVADEITVTIPGNPLEVSDEGISLIAAALELDFVGAGVTATEAAGVITITIPGGASGLEIEDEAVSLSTAVTKINFAGAGVTATEPVADEILVTIPGGGGASIEVEDEGVSLTTAVTKFDFTGAGVTVTEPVADEVLVTIPGGTSGLEVEDEAVSLSTAVSKINFAGAGVTATEPVADEILVTIPGGGGGGGGQWEFIEEIEIVGAASSMAFTTGLTADEYKLTGEVNTSTGSGFVGIGANADVTSANYLTQRLIGDNGFEIGARDSNNRAMNVNNSGRNTIFKAHLRQDQDGYVRVMNEYDYTNSGNDMITARSAVITDSTVGSITEITVFCTDAATTGAVNFQIGSKVKLYKSVN